MNSVSCGSALDTETALEFLRKVPVNLLLVDWTLRGEGPTVPEFVKTVRFEKLAKRIYLMTGTAKAEQIARELGLDGFLLKPVQPDVLLKLAQS